MSEPTFHLLWKGVQTGPYSVSKIRELVESGKAGMMHIVITDQGQIPVEDFLKRMATPPPPNYPALLEAERAAAARVLAGQQAEQQRLRSELDDRERESEELRAAIERPSINVPLQGGTQKAMYPRDGNCFAAKEQFLLRIRRETQYSTYRKIVQGGAIAIYVIVAISFVVGVIAGIAQLANTGPKKEFLYASGWGLIVSTFLWSAFLVALTKFFSDGAIIRADVADTLIDAQYTRD